MGIGIEVGTGADVTTVLLKATLGTLSILLTSLCTNKARTTALKLADKNAPNTRFLYIDLRDIICIVLVMRTPQKILLAAIVSLVVSIGVLSFLVNNYAPHNTQAATIISNIVSPRTISEDKEFVEDHPLQIEAMRQAEYKASKITIERTLAQTSIYNQYLASYNSEGNKIFALLTIPKGNAPIGGFPAIVFNHGYIQPESYRTTEKYEAYVAGFARAGFVVIKPDYRGHGNSEGEPLGAYYSTAYNVDVLIAFESISAHSSVNPERVGMWGHSMGGHIALRAMVVNPKIKAGVIWAGVVASYKQMQEDWTRSTPWQPSVRERNAQRPSRSDLIAEFGEINNNPDFWDSISPINFVSDISGPVQIHHGLADKVVPPEFSSSLDSALKEAQKEVEYYTYVGADHNLSGSAFTPALNRSVEFFKQHL